MNIELIVVSKRVKCDFIILSSDVRQLRRIRQRAFLGSQTEHYRKLRNKVQRMAATLVRDSIRVK